MLVEPPPPAALHQDDHLECNLFATSLANDREQQQQQEDMVFSDCREPTPCTDYQDIAALPWIRLRTWMLRRYESACAANNPGLHLIPIPIMPCFSHHRCALSSTSQLFRWHVCAVQAWIDSESRRRSFACLLRLSNMILARSCWKDICWQGLLCIGFNHGLTFVSVRQTYHASNHPSSFWLVKAAALPSMKTLVVSLATSGPHYRSNDLVYISWVYIRGMGFLPNGVFNWKHECVACPKTLQTYKINHQRDVNALRL